MLRLRVRPTIFIYSYLFTYSVSWVFLALALCDVKVLNAESGEVEELSGLPKRCSYDYAYGYYGAYCANLGLNKVPSLKSGVEVCQS